MRIKLWGVRGSIPTPLSTEQLQEKLFQALTGATQVDLTNDAEVRAYIARLKPSVRGVVGGNTTCIEIDTGSEIIIIDCGSGMLALGYHLMAREFGRGQGVAHIFLTHAHWDHLQGYPFFAPAYVPGNKLIFYAVQQNPQVYLEHQQSAPMYFPIPPNAMSADKEFVQLREGEVVQIGRVMVNSLALYHPGTAYAYRFDDGESVFVFASDGEYKSLAEQSLRRYIDFFANADALVFDSQYSLRDVFLSKTDWGHSSAIIGVDIAERARVKRLVTFHHDPTHSDEQVYAIAAAAREYAVVNQLNFKTEVLVGVEGMELFLGQTQALEALTHTEGDVVTVALAGHLNQNAMSVARQALENAIHQQPAGVLLDLTLLASLDAVSLKDLLDVARHHPDTPVAVLTPAAHIRRMLDQSSATDVVQLFNNRAQAISTLLGPVHLRLTAATVDNYQVEKQLFVDDVGVLYQAAHALTGTPALMRVVAGAPHETNRQTVAEQLERWQRAKHPSLLPVQAILNTHAEWLAWVGPRPTGLSLREWRNRHADAPRQTVRKVAHNLCKAVAALHSFGLEHGDLRPECVVVAENHVLLARHPLFARPKDQPLDRYRAPEQLRNRLTTQRTDVYVLGILLYELFLHAHPFAADMDELRLTLQLYSQPQNPRLLWPEISPELENLLMSMLASTPEDRPPSAQWAYDRLSAMPTALLERH